MSLKLKAAAILGAIVLFSLAAQAGWGIGPNLLIG